MTPAKENRDRKAMLHRLKKRGITPENFPWELDQMTDQEITFMLDLTEGKGMMDDMRRAQPEQTDRQYAEFIRDF